MGALVYNHDTISAGVSGSLQLPTGNGQLVYFPPAFVRKFSDTWLHDCYCSDESAQKRTTYMWSIEFRVTVESSTWREATPQRVPVSSSLNEGDDDL